MNKHLIITLLLLFLSVLSAEIMQIRINDQNKDIINWLKKIEATEIRSFENGIEAYMDDEYLDYLNDNNIPFSIISTESEWQRNIGDYSTYDQIVTELNDIAAANPDFIELFSLGTTLGHQYYDTGYVNYEDFQYDIWCVKLSDNPQINEDEPNTFMVGGIHSNEPTSIEVDMHILLHLVNNYGVDSLVTKLINESQIWFIPLMNPDGYRMVRDLGYMGHRKNIRDNNGNGVPDGAVYESYGIDGVDLNRNFGYTYGGNPNTWSPAYNGTNAWSEPEVVNIRDLLRSHKFWGGITYHSTRQSVLYPLGNYSSAMAYDHYIMQDLAEDMANTIPRRNSSGIQTGYYNFEQANCLVASGTMGDWGYCELRLFSFTLELCWTDIPPANLLQVLCEDNLEAALIFLDRVHHSTVTGNITDETRSPVVAEIYVQEIDFEAGMTSVEPVRSDSTFGRYYRVLLPGTYTFTFSLEGYDDIVVEDVVVNDSTQTELNITFGSLTFVEDVSISFTGNSVELSWQLEEGFDYEVYSSDLPYSEFQLDLDGILEGNSWQKTISEAREFYKVRKIPSF
ncbi:MAG: hypothetical protein APR54_00050 [Candidatus Cloacimonas sp. SDB]|nr:MAG: hypothetical protein APR54_00050 [Candidatus Cloacimonas sp. SDB]